VARANLVLTNGSVSFAAKHEHFIKCAYTRREKLQSNIPLHIARMHITPVPFRQHVQGDLHVLNLISLI